MKKPDEDKIKRYLNNQSTAEEADEIISWFNSKEGAAYLENSFFNDNELDASISSDFFTENAYKDLEKGIRKEEERKNFSHLRRKENNKQRALIVATLLFLVVAISYLKFSLEKEEIQQIEEVPKLEVRENPKGQKSSLLLPDGTEIKLNVESRLAFNEGFKGPDRKVYLYGEAFFNIAENPERPFVVVVNDSIEVKALGTSFNITAFQDENKINIALTTGKVQIKNHFELIEDTDKKEYYLIPGEAYSYNKETGISNSTTFDKQKVIAWKDGILIFEDTSFKDSKRMLERWYGVDIEVKKNSRKINSFTGEFKNESLKNILENMSMACKFNYSMSGKKILIF